jgi:CRISPR/Cas system endoribonuclease Cas6 (RAMP superfamily)
MPSIEEPKTLPLNNVFKDREATYNDKNVNETISPIVEKTLEAPLDSIKTAITLNKKIAFVNELFKENVVEYAKSIDRLNQAIDLNDALRMFSEMKHTYNWDNANELVQDLDRLIKRRYA